MHNHRNCAHTVLHAQIHVHFSEKMALFIAYKIGQTLSFLSPSMGRGHPALTLSPTRGSTLSSPSQTSIPHRIIAIRFNVIRNERDPGADSQTRDLYCQDPHPPLRDAPGI
ncbi:unnamed protein product [Lepidochelys kempii]